MERFVSRHEYSFQECVLQGLTKEMHIHGYVFHGFAAHITDVAGYYESSMRLLDPAVRQDLFCPQRPIYAKENDAASTYMDPQGGCVNSLVDDAQLRHVIADKDVKVGPGVHLEGTEKYPLVLGKGAEV